MQTLKRIFIKDTPVLALKILKRGMGVYFGSPFHGYVLNCHFIWNSYVIYDKAKFIFLNLYGTTKVKLTSSTQVLLYIQGNLSAIDTSMDCDSFDSMS